MLYLVGTPIGNIDDMSPRAREILEKADIVACEDTRRTGLLLQQIGVKNHLISYHEHNKASKSNAIVDHLANNEIVALVSDAGMPSISDPGEDLVKLCIENGYEVSTIPGPAACITALVLSGLDTRRYHFEGFLPSEGSERKKRLDAISKIHETIVLYEAPHRLLKLIDELNKFGFGNCKVAFCRELTKKFEEVIRIRVCESKEFFEKKEPRGEFVVCLEPIALEDAPEMKDISQEELDTLVLEYKNLGMTTKEISREISKKTGRKKKEIYDVVVNLLK